MKDETINISNADPRYYFTDILKDNGYNGLIPTNTIVNKRRPSLGVTHCELYSERNSILIEPFVTVIEVKKQKMGDKICAVMSKDYDINELVTYLMDDSIIYKKVITTPESFTKVIRVLKKIDPKYRENYFLLIDECDKLIQHALFRKRIYAPIEEFFRFKNKAMVSATPIKPTHATFEDQGFVWLDFKPTFNYKKALKLVITNNIRASLSNTLKLLKLKKDGKPVFLFTNCKRTILYFTRLELVKDDFKVFCAEDLDNKFFQLNKTANVEYSVINQSYAKYNAFTSRFFAAVDMHPDDYAHIIVVTNVPHVQHSIIDPLTDAIQISGRDRLQASAGLTQHATITHITNIYPKRLSGKEIETDKELYLIQRLQDLAEKSPYPIIKSFLQMQIDKELLSQVLKQDGSIDPFLMDNYDFKKANKQLYHSKEALLSAYVQSEYFTPILKIVRHPFSDEHELALARAKGGIPHNKAFIKLLHEIVSNYDPFNTEHDDIVEHLKKLEDKDKLLCNAYGELGHNKIVKLGYAKTKIKAAIFDKKLKEGTRPLLMIDNIVSSFKLNIKVYADDIKSTLQEIYNKFNYERSYGVIKHAKGSHIECYFICKRFNDKKKSDDGKTKSYYRLFSPIDKIATDLEYMVSYPL